MRNVDSHQAVFGLDEYRRRCACCPCGLSDAVNPMQNDPRRPPLSGGFDQVLEVHSITSTFTLVFAGLLVTQSAIVGSANDATL